MTLAANREFNEALHEFEKSERIDPKNGLNKYQKANTLVKLERYESAIQELEALQSLMPKEAPIPMLLGKIYKKLSKNDKAHYYFNMALDLESKDAQKIKGFIESLHNNGNDEEMDI
jgi:anaphase-promoting complex subunit 3